MNEPIINPWFFYLASRMNAIIVICVIAIIVGGCMAVVYLMTKYIDEQEHPKMLKYGILLIIIPVVFICVIPSETTLYKMLLAHYATPDNINDVVNMIIDGARRIVEATNG